MDEMSSGLLDDRTAQSFNNGLPSYFQHILSLFEKASSFSHVADFAGLALQAFESQHGNECDPDRASMRADLLCQLFHASLKTCHFDQAYSALSRYDDLKLQKAALRSLIISILAVSGSGTTGLKQILHLPTSLFPSIASHIDEALVALTYKQRSFNSFSDFDKNGADAPDYQRILQAYRLARSDYRGAAEIAYGNFQRLRNARDNPSSHFFINKSKEANNQRQMVEEDDPESKEIRHELLSLINLLACVDKSEAYILVDKEDSSPGFIRRRSTPGDDDGNVFMDDADGTSNLFNPDRRRSSGAGRRDSRSSGGNASVNGASQFYVPRKRIIVTLDHLRREYQAELDRVSRIERGDWEFGLLDDNVADNDETMLLA